MSPSFYSLNGNLQAVAIQNFITKPQIKGVKTVHTSFNRWSPVAVVTSLMRREDKRWDDDDNFASTVTDVDAWKFTPDDWVPSSSVSWTMTKKLQHIITVVLSCPAIKLMTQLLHRCSVFSVMNVNHFQYLCKSHCNMDRIISSFKFHFLNISTSLI